MKTPSKLYRYRPLEDGLLDRELGALQNSYLYAAPFSAMNDPMEEFYKSGGGSDRIINAMLSQMIDRLALVSFAATHEDLPMWAYYGSNFAGMCLEFDTTELLIGDFQNEKLRPVTYARGAPPSTIADRANEGNEEAVIALITRKRSEWAHEKEWRVITGEIGPKHYLDDALRRVFLGPRVQPGHAARVCEVLDRRPVEVLQGEIDGFELRFRSIKPARAPEECERVGAGGFDQTNIINEQDQLQAFFAGPIDALLHECRRTARRPNLEEISDFDVSVNCKGALFIWEIYRLRSGRDVYHKRYFDRRMRLLSE